MDSKHQLPSDLFGKYKIVLDELDPIITQSEVSEVQGGLVKVSRAMAKKGDMCDIFSHSGRRTPAEVVGVGKQFSHIMPFENTHGFMVGDKVRGSHGPMHVRLHPQLMGRVLNAQGHPIDGKGFQYTGQRRSVFGDKLPFRKRDLIKEPLPVGVKAIDGLLTIGKGQRVGLFSGSGVGKSTLLSMVARNTEADVAVVVLCGERGREVNEFIQRSLGDEGLKKSIVVVATSDEPPLAKVRSVQTATTIAEFFRDEGKDVLLMVDSITRLALAQREIGASLGEPPTTKAYTPSVFNLLPQLTERVGRCKKGSISAFYTVLVEGDDMDEPIADAMRGILDGHIVLSRKKANQSYYPAIDIPQSISRLSIDVCSEEHHRMIDKVREWLSAYDSIEDLLHIGAYARGSNPAADTAIDKKAQLDSFLKQSIGEAFSFGESVELLLGLDEPEQQVSAHERPLLFR